MNRRILAWMLASCMAVNMVSPAFAESAEGGGETSSSEASSSESASSSETSSSEASSSEASSSEASSSEASSSEASSSEASSSEASSSEASSSETGSSEASSSEASSSETSSSEASSSEASSSASNALSAATPVTTADEPVDLETAILDYFVRKAVRSELNGKEPTLTNLANISTLTVSGNSVTDIMGIDLLTGLTTLNLSNNDIANLGRIDWSKLTKLTELNLSGNKNLTTLTPLQGSSIETLNLSGCSALQELSGSMFLLTGVTDLDLSGCNVTNIAGVKANCASLKVLNLKDNKSFNDVFNIPASVEDLNLSGTAVGAAAFGKNLTSLRKISLAGQGTIDNVANLFPSTALTDVDFSGCNIATMTGVGGDSLVNVNLSGNAKFNAVSTISNVSGLEKLNLSGTAVTDISKLANNTNLTALDLSNTPITSSSGLSGLTSLTPATLNLQGTKITNIAQLKKDLPSGFASQDGYQAWLDATIASINGATDNDSSKKPALQTALSDAENAKKDVRVSTSLEADKLDNGTRWVIQGDMNDFIAAIETAQNIYNSVASDDDAFETATTNLRAAITTFQGKIKTVNKVTVDKNALRTSIDAANTAKTGVKTSADGSDVPTTNQWVTPVQMAALNTSFNKAQKVYDDPSATQVQVDAAKTDLDTAIETFKTACKAGTKVPADKTFLAATIDGAEQKIKSVRSGDPANFFTYEQLIPDADKTAFQKAIDDAKAIHQKAGATQADIDEANSTLAAAQAVFENALIFGTKRPDITVNPNAPTTGKVAKDATATVKLSDLATNCGQNHGKLIITKATSETENAATVKVADDKQSVTVTGVAAGDSKITVTVKCAHPNENTLLCASQDFVITYTVSTEITAFEALPDIQAGRANKVTDKYTSAKIADTLKTEISEVFAKGSDTVKVPVTGWTCGDYDDTKAGTYTFTGTLGTAPTGYTVAADAVPTVNVIVAAANKAPVAKSVATQTLQKGGASVTLKASDLATDGDNDPLTLAIKTRPAGLTATLNGANNEITLTALASMTADSGSVVLTVSDGQGGAVDVTINVSVTAEAAITSVANPKTTGTVAVGSVDRVTLSQLAADCTNGHGKLGITKVESATPGSATAAIAADKQSVNVTGVAAGTSKITVTVGCESCAPTKAFEIDYTVTEASETQYTVTTKNDANATITLTKGAAGGESLDSGDKVNKGAQVYVRVNVTNPTDYAIDSFKVNGAITALNNNQAGPFVIERDTVFEVTTKAIDHKPTVTISGGATLVNDSYKLSDNGNDYEVSFGLMPGAGYVITEVAVFETADPNNTLAVTSETSASGTTYKFTAKKDTAYTLVVTTKVDDNFVEGNVSGTPGGITQVIAEKNPALEKALEGGNVLKITAADVDKDQTASSAVNQIVAGTIITAVDESTMVPLDISIVNTINQSPVPFNGTIKIITDIPTSLAGKQKLVAIHEHNGRPQYIPVNLRNDGKLEFTLSGLSTVVLAAYESKSVVPPQPQPDPQPTPKPNGGGSSGGSGGGGGGGSSSSNKGASIFSKLTDTINSILKGNLTGVSGAAGTAASNGTPVTQAAAKKAVSSAVSQAKKQGKDTADVLFRNVTSFPAGVLESIASQAQKSGVKANIVADTMHQNGAVDVRVSVFASAAARLGRELNLYARVGNDAVEKHFAKYYANRIAVIHMGQKGSFGLPVSVAAKTSLSGVDPKELFFYSYDPATNAYTKLPQTNAFIDVNGYVHFTTDMGNDTIISVGALERR